MIFYLVAAAAFVGLFLLLRLLTKEPSKPVAVLAILGSIALIAIIWFAIAFGHWSETLTHGSPQPPNARGIYSR